MHILMKKLKGFFLCTLNGQIGAPNVMSTLDPTLVIMFEQVVQSHIKTYVFAIHSWSHTS